MDGATERWVRECTGIHSRRYADKDTATSDLAVRAAARLLAEHPGAAERIDALVLATCTPDQPQPATAAIVQHKLGLRSIPALDINAVCSGFLYGLAIADGLRAGLCHAGYVLVIGADKFSGLMDRTDRRTVSLFGDGAGAAPLGPVPDGYGMLTVRMVTDGELHHLGSVLPIFGGLATPATAPRRVAATPRYNRVSGRSGALRCTAPDAAP